MSRKIDMQDPGSWSEEDRQYLQDRNMLPADAVNVGPANVHPDDNPLPPVGGTTPSMDTEDDVIFDGPSDEYDGMTVEELRTELRLREMAVSGTKNELVYRLRAADAKPDEEEGTTGEVED